MPDFTHDLTHDFNQEVPVDVDLDVHWIHGSRKRSHSADPLVQVHACDPHTFLLRQSKSVTFEAPFLYLFMGRDRAVLFDTGATKDQEKFPLRSTVDAILDKWLAEHPDPQRQRYELVVAHTHPHGDHVAGDTQLVDRPDTVIVPHDPDAVASFFGIENWPDQEVELDLGGRVLRVTGAPGHHAAAIAVHDPRTGFLLTGDTVYPGRLYVQDFPAFLHTLDRLVAWTETFPVTHVMGCHVEMTTTPGRDYPLGTTYQPDEASLPMTVEQLKAVREAAYTVADQPGAHQFDDFAIWNGPCRGAALRQIARTLTNRLLRR